ncbi:hypothetical protein [Methylomicrobium sp. Wu6]|uniref:hypothetical protein n=1 Tax=Methylomicrobium sp. Wu6 TaxID=3107928 RepID=UPI002DD68BE4|nr:hypothetical protein [Methylomicrobium sp. Wu6]MEC4750030.1 hypothetical protein [Methylomicrobium sp. Wu6]
MARTPSDIIDSSVKDAEAPGIKPELFNEQTQALAEIDAHYGDIIPYERDRTIQETRFFLSQSAEAMLEAGKRLTLLKEHEPHGEWLNCLDKIGIDRTVAFRMMQAAVKFSNVATSHHLKQLGKSKLLELMVLDNEEITGLVDEGGTVRGLKLDDVDRMSVKELRAALRKSREETKQIAETKDLIIQKKDQKLNQLDEQLAMQELNRAKTAFAEPDTAALAARDELQYTAERIKAAVMTDLRKRLNELFEAAPGQHIQFASACLIEIGRELAILRGDFNLPDTVSESLMPEWLTQDDLDTIQGKES